MSKNRKAKISFYQAVAITVDAIKALKEQNFSEADILANLKSKINDEEFVEKGRKNHLVAEVNNQLGTNYTYREICDASDTIVRASIPTVTNSVALEGRLADGSLGITIEVDQGTADNDNTTIEPINAENIKETKMENINETIDNETRETVAEAEAMTLSVMGEPIYLKPSFIAAAGAVVGTGAALFKNGVTAANVVGGLAGVTASYFVADYVLGEQENTLVNKSLAAGMGFAMGAGCSMIGNAIDGYFTESDSSEENVPNVNVIINQSPAPQSHDGMGIEVL